MRHALFLVSCLFHHLQAPAQSLFPPHRSLPLFLRQRLPTSAPLVGKRRWKKKLTGAPSMARYERERVGAATLSAFAVHEQGGWRTSNLQQLIFPHPLPSPISAVAIERRSCFSPLPNRFCPSWFLWEDAMAIAKTAAAALICRLSQCAIWKWNQQVNCGHSRIVKKELATNDWLWEQEEQRPCLWALSFSGLNPATHLFSRATA